MMFKVSVIVPVYNVEKYLERCLDSLINQSLREIEIILIDDGSKDNSSKICDRYAERDSRIKVIHKQNQGLGMARNTGLDVAKGEYVVFVDSDDFVSTDAYKKMYDQIKRDGADMLIANYYLYNTLNGNIKEVKAISSSKIVKLTEIKKIACQIVGVNPKEKELDDIGMSVWKNMYSRSFLEEHSIRFYSEREFVSEDAIFHLMAIPKMKIITMTTEPYYYYCKNGEASLSATFRESKFEEYKVLYKKESELLELENILDYGKYNIASAFLGNIRAHFKQLASQNYKMNEKRKIAREIINDALVQSILTWYPYQLTPVKQRLFSVMIRKKCIDLLLLFGRVQSMRSKC